MLDNYLKVVLLTPDLIYDTTIEEFDSDDFQRIFKDYEKLDKLSEGNLLENGGQISFLDVSNSLFDYITSQIISKQGRIRLLSTMHVFNEERKIVLCLPFNEFLEYVRVFKMILTEHRSQLMNEVNSITMELLYLSKIKFSGEPEGSKND